MEDIRLTGVRKTYGKEVAVENMDLLVEPGDFLTILGPSGCGKTTTLRLIAGLEEPDRGEIHLADRLVFSREQGVIVPPENRNLGLIFQSYALWPHMTVRRNITLGLEHARLPREKIDRRLQQALEKVQLEELRDRYPSELSGGQQQRVAVARLIAMEPTILLMDEPLSNLDAMLRVDMRGELRRLHKDLEATTVYVTHDQVEALTLSDTVVVMDKAVVQQQASPYDIYHRPASLFVAEFVGNPRINRLDGMVRGGNGETTVDFGDFSVPFDANLNVRNGSVVATLRPEAIQLSKTEKEGWLKVRIDAVQPTGSETVIKTSSDRLKLTVLQPGFFQMATDDPLWLRFEAESLNFFDSETGKNLAA